MLGSDQAVRRLAIGYNKGDARMWKSGCVLGIDEGLQIGTLRTWLSLKGMISSRRGCST